MAALIGAIGEPAHVAVLAGGEEVVQPGARVGDQVRRGRSRRHRSQGPGRGREWRPSENGARVGDEGRRCGRNGGREQDGPFRADLLVRVAEMGNRDEGFSVADGRKGTEDRSRERELRWRRRAVASARGPIVQSRRPAAVRRKRLSQIAPSVAEMGGSMARGSRTRRKPGPRRPAGRMRAPARVAGRSSVARSARGSGGADASRRSRRGSRTRGRRR